MGLCVALAGAQVEAVPLGDVARETRSYYMNPPGFSWWVTYDIEFASQELHIYTSIYLYSSGGIDHVPQSEIDSLAPYWEGGIEGLWNNRYGILHNNQYYYDIIYDVIFEYPSDHYNVRVRPGFSQGKPRTTMTLWDTADTGRVAAHEYGHMVGNYDEYSGGATYPPSNPIIDSSSLMGSTAPAVVTYARHYEPVVDWLELKYPQPQDTLEVVQPVSIDIRAGSNSNRFNLHSKGVLPVAILGDENFDVYDINVSSLKLSGAGPMTKGNGDTISSFRDVNNDEWDDLKVYFRIADLVDVEYDTTELSLKGSVDLNEGTQLFWGRDSIRIVGPGDVNGDGFVGQADLSIIISNWGLDNASYEQGDVSGDGVVEGADYSQVMSYWGQSTPTPEPATLALVLLGSLAVLSRRGAKSGRKGGLYKKNVACTG